jgi:glutamate/tyrosine decarboxylase-like PLP-dependent enzyme
VEERRDAAVALGADEFRAIGHALVDDLAALFEALESPSELAVATGESPAEVQAALGGDGLPETGTPAAELVREASDLVLGHSTHIGHPRFWGYVCGSQAPIGALADLLAAAVNPNVGGWPLGPVAAEIERQTVRWLAELIGFPSGDEAGGLLVSGGNMANFVGFVAARRAKAPWDVASDGTGAGRLTAYCSAETHTWAQKAADLFGIGGAQLRWIPTDGELRLDTTALREAIAADRAAGSHPFLVVGTGGSVSTGAVDPLPELAGIAREEDLWFHVDGAYGGFAACLPDAPADLKGLALADSVAIDPHKWLYVPVEAGCTLVRERQALLDAFAYRPPYYHLPEGQTNFYELGPQNSRGFRALKVWLALRQAGRSGYVRMIGDDCRLARLLYELADADPELEARTQGLSIATFRYAPPDVPEEELDALNEELLARIQSGGEAFVSNAVIDGRYWLRACFVNFRTQEADVRALPGIVKRLGAELRGVQSSTLL